MTAYFKNAFSSHRTLLKFLAGAYLLGGLYIAVLSYTNRIELTLSELFKPVLLGEFISLLLIWFVGKALIEALRNKTLKIETIAPQTLASASTSFVILYAFITLFIKLKALISHAVPYYLDPLLAKADQLIHLGEYPHEFLHNLMPLNSWVWQIDFMYALWFIIMYGYVAKVILSPPKTFAKHHFLLAFAGVWIVLGNALATLLSSCGPIFYDMFYGEIAEYAEGLSTLRAFAQDTPLFAMEFYDMLVDFVENDSLFDFNSPSAMPSIHVAMSALFFFHAKTYESRNLAVAMGIYLAIVTLGSVYLLWHYATDAYLTIGITYALWITCQKLLEKNQPELNK